MDWQSVLEKHSAFLARSSDMNYDFPPQPAPLPDLLLSMNS